MRKLPNAAALIRHGERLTHVLGCTGCHGAQLEGTFFTKDEPQFGPLYASNLTVEVPEYTDAQLDGHHPQGCASGTQDRLGDAVRDFPQA